MSCEFITKGRLEPCKDSVGGLKSVYFVKFGTITGVTYDVTDTDFIKTVTGTPSAYKYDIRGNSNYTENIQSSTENGTTSFEQVLSLTLKKLTKEQHKSIRLLAYGRPHIIVQDQNDNYFLAGLENGVEVTAGTVVTGASMNDLSGYTLTFTGMEKKPANFTDAAVMVGGATGVTVVVGT